MTENGNDWARLLRAANDGDAGAYAAFLQAVTPVVRGIVRSKAGGMDPDAREDIVQEVLLAIHLKRHSWVPDMPVRPWVYAITRYKVVDALRRRGRSVQISADDMFEEIAAPPEADPFETRDVERTLDRLDERSGSILRAIVAGASLSEIAPRFSLSEGAARVALHRALAKLAALRNGDKL